MFLKLITPEIRELTFFLINSVRQLLFFTYTKNYSIV